MRAKKSDADVSCVIDAVKWGWGLLGVAADLQTNEVGVKSEGE